MWNKGVFSPLNNKSAKKDSKKSDASSMTTTGNLDLAQPEPTQGMTHWKMNESHLKTPKFKLLFQLCHMDSALCFLSPPALEAAKCRALPGHYYDGLLRKCVMCVEVCGRHPAECWQHCHSESQLKYSVMLSASTSCFIKKKSFQDTGWSGWENSSRQQEDEHRCRMSWWKDESKEKRKKINFETL